jgi:cytochrome bd ubiquinol oxidase subunit II
VDPALLLGGVIVLALTAYALLGGADYGGGVWDLAASGPGAAAERAAIARAIGPIWEANHVWLILVVVVLFSAFPSAFARLSTYLHIPLMLALVGIILRGSAFMFRAYGPAEAGFQRRWGLVFAGASVATPVLLGVVVGALTEGRLDSQAQGFSALYVRPWLTPFAWSVGAFALVLFSFLAAVYLTVSGGSPDVIGTFRRRALGAGVVTGVLALVVFVLAGDAPHVQAALTESAWAWPLHLLTGAAAVATLALLWTRHFYWARVTAAIQVSGILWGWALAQYPYLIRPDLRFDAAAAPRPVLVALLWILLAGAIVLLPSLVYLYRLFTPHRSGSSHVH